LLASQAEPRPQRAGNVLQPHEVTRGEKALAGGIGRDHGADVQLSQIAHVDDERIRGVECRRGDPPASLG